MHITCTRRIPFVSFYVINVLFIYRMFVLLLYCTTCFCSSPHVHLHVWVFSAIILWSCNYKIVRARSKSFYILFMTDFHTIIVIIYYQIVSCKNFCIHFILFYLSYDYIFIYFFIYIDEIQITYQLLYNKPLFVAQQFLIHIYCIEFLFL